MFIPLTNSEDSCSYHPGKMKFYSCRGCGANQYFSCCNKCMQCSAGCKKSKHIAWIGDSGAEKFTSSVVDQENIKVVLKEKTQNI